MFEELVETQKHSSGSAGSRNGYFLVSGAVLVFGLSAALVFSLFAVDLNMDMNDFDMVELVAPVDSTPPAKLPELETAPKAEAKPKPGPAAAPRLATRTVNMARIDETPREAPTAVSTTQNTVRERPAGALVAIGKFDSDGGTTGVAGRGPGGNGDGTGEGGLGDGTAVAKVEKEEAAEPPPPPAPPVKKEAPSKPIVVSLGVVNGRATSLPKPAIPAAAKVAKVAGTVAVKVVIDEKGNVISASAVSGNEMLRGVSESAARSAKFNPTLLSGEPTKASGVINYNFG